MDDRWHSSRVGKCWSRSQPAADARAVNRALTRFELLVGALLNAQEELQNCLIVIVELVRVQGVGYKLPVDETNGEPDFEFRKLSRSDVFNLKGLVNNRWNTDGHEGKVRTKTLSGRLKYGPVLSPIAP